MIADSPVFTIGDLDLARGGRDECLVITGLNDGRFRRFCFNVKVDGLAMVIFHQMRLMAVIERWYKKRVPVGGD